MKELNSYFAFPVQTVVKSNEMDLFDEGRILAKKCSWTEFENHHLEALLR